MAVPAQVLDCFADQRWRLSNLYWITDEKGRRVKFEPYPTQLDLLDNLHFLNLILKARQLGFTTFIELYLLDVCVFHPDTRAGVVAHTKADAEAIFRDKVKFAYDNLPEEIRATVPIIRDNTSTLELGNNSVIKVGTSLRGGTLQYLHISEFGKICARYPHKAREILTGALNTIAPGQVAFIESTAEGQEGAFYDMCEAAQSKERMGTRLTEMDWKLHFFPWWREPRYSIDPEGVAIPQTMERYFADLETQGIVLTPGQRAWYVKKAETQGEDMKREYPATPKEAFEASIEGAYYSQQMAAAEKAGRIGKVPYEPALRVETWWDIGRNDDNVIWFVQRHHRELRVIDYYANSGENAGHYAKVLSSKPYVYSRHVGPHDAAVTEYTQLENKSRQQVFEDLGLRPFEVVPRGDVLDGIEAVRNMLPRCWFDAEACADGIKALKAYRKDWDEERGVWKSGPRHDWASHPADAFRMGAMAREATSNMGPAKLNRPRLGVA